ncbi:MAG: hypothetical protein PHV59_04905 [Victivallales bacterium]|nr:hypothetical protein [Victivallales bacterium]
MPVLKKLSAVILLSVFAGWQIPQLEAADARELSPADFLYRVRHPAGRKRWALMDGRIFHRRRGGDTVEAALYLGILFNKDRTLAQLLINASQGYMVGQDFSKGKDGTSVIPLNAATEKEPLLGNFGLRPEDLTMAFLYWEMIMELPADSVKMIACRVFQLRAPDGGETATVWISRKYYFPIKVQWTKTGKQEAFRSLEASSFETRNRYGVIKCLELYGPGWRTRIDFTKIEVGTPENNVIPKNLFRKLPGDTDAYAKYH